LTHHKNLELSRRIARIEGHVKAIRKMIEDEKTYPEIVQQVSAVRASLDSLTQVIVNDLVEYYVKHSKNEEANKAAMELRETVSRIL
jgi:CsoR family transcriptional regulator, copper-sensing transcriptional repressor